jgi:pantoate--beta-alanine ligase
VKTVKTPAAVREALSDVRLAGKRIGFVPTMGALHGGHTSLIRMARNRTDCVVVSVFVNPKQFGPCEDFARYPRDEARDAAILMELGCDLLFLPSDKDLYSPMDRTHIAVGDLSDVLCGLTRPGHFQGVVLIVAKLFNIVQPDEAFFGQKDAQQAVIIQRMAADLDFPVKIKLGPTVRETDGLAMSSRNRYLDQSERKRAIALFKGLHDAKTRIERGERRAEVVRDALRRIMEGAGFDIEYVEVVNGERLTPLERIEGTILVAAAGRLGQTRLIDNIALSVREESVEEIVLEFPAWSRYGFAS